MLNAIVVTILEHKRIIVESKGNINDTDALLNLGFLKKGKSYYINFDNENEQLFLIEQLAGIGALFSYGHGWAPSQVMDYLKEQGKIDFSYKEIMWRSPNNYEIIDR